MAKEIDEILEFGFGNKGEPGCGGLRDEGAVHPHPRRSEDPQ